MFNKLCYINNGDSYMINLDRFKEAQKNDYEIAKNEIKNGKKISHWMWYIFPQIKGLGQSETSKYYEIKDLEEAKAYLNDDILGNRLLELVKILLDSNTNNIVDIFGEIDSMKLKSSITLFNYVSDNDIFNKILEKYFNGKKDNLTISICKKMRGNDMFNLQYLKNEFNENDYNNFINDIKENFPKYKKALYDYYESNNEKFPFEDYNFINELLLVIFLNEYGYSKNLVIKVLDNLLTNISNNMDKVLVLNFLCGFGIIDEHEMNERNPYIELINK